MEKLCFIYILLYSCNSTPKGNSPRIKAANKVKICFELLLCSNVFDSYKSIPFSFKAKKDQRNPSVNTAKCFFTTLFALYNAINSILTCPVPVYQLFSIKIVPSRYVSSFLASTRVKQLEPGDRGSESKSFFSLNKGGTSIRLQLFVCHVYPIFRINNREIHEQISVRL